jgi:pseudouridine kinase
VTATDSRIHRLTYPDAVSDLADAPRVVVIGGANVDVLARPHLSPVSHTSNPGVVTVTAGGVGRNIAETLARLGTAVTLVAVVGSDAHGDLVLASTRDAGVDVDLVRRGLTPTGTYVALLDEGGELVSAVADMAATGSLSTTDIDLAAEVIAAADLVVLDGNLDTPVLAAAWDAAVAAGVGVVLDPVSVPKAAAIAQLLGPERPLALLSAGATGPTGSVLTTREATTKLSALPASVEDVTGAGDAMLAAYCHELLAGATPYDAARYGHAAAALTVASRHTVRHDLTDALVRSLL